MRPPPAPALSVSFRFDPSAEHVGSVSRFVKELSGKYIADADAISRLELAAYELMENIVKYTSRGQGQFHFELAQSETGYKVTLGTENHASSEHRSDLTKRVDALSNASDPLEHYDSAIAESARRPFGSGLGLVRIRAEGEMQVEHRIDGELVVVRVEAAFPEGRQE
jgi:hypothetical protein